jgi:Ca2+/H+ antiporter
MHRKLVLHAATLDFAKIFSEATIKVALVVAPLLVLVSWAIGHPMTLGQRA